MTLTIDGIEQLAGGTVGGDLIIKGDLTVQSGVTSVVNQTVSGTVTIDLDDTEALLVRKDGDAGDVLVVDTTNSRVGILGLPTVAGRVLDIWGGDEAIITGADFDAITRTDATDKYSRIGTQHFTNAEEPVASIVAINQTAINSLRVGGGTSTFNSATEITFWTAADTITTGGTLRMTIDSAGDVGIGIAPVTGCQLLLPLENDPVTPTLGFGAGADGIYQSAEGTLRVAIAGAARFQFTGGQIVGVLSGSGAILDEVASATNPAVIPNGGDFDTGIGWRAGNVGVLIGGALNCIEFANVGAAPAVGFYATAAIVQQTGVAVTSAGIHAALVNLGLITA